MSEVEMTTLENQIQQKKWDFDRTDELIRNYEKPGSISSAESIETR